MADIKEFKCRIVGVRPLIVHNVQLADPLNDYTKRISELTAMSAKAKKQEDIQLKLARIEFEGSMYLDENKCQVIPSENILRAIRDGGAEQRNGKKIEATVSLGEDVVPIEYDGPTDIDEMFDAKGPLGHIFRFRKQAKPRGQGVVLRTRPRFPKWALSFTVQIVLGAGIGEKNVRDAIEDAGKLKGLGDWRPRYGLFVLDHWSEVKARKAA
ncbi:hypothetical protein WMF30_10895 [Sorangium sp. So ce134]